MAEQDNGKGRRQPRKPAPVDNTYGHLQPQALDVEKVVLGALMIDKDAYAVVCEMLYPESFYEPRNQMIYSAIRDLSMAERPVDVLTVTDQLAKNGKLEEVGGPVYISELSSRVASSANIEYHARIIAQKFVARQLISYASVIETKAFDGTTDIDDLMQEAEGALFELSQRNMKKEYTQIDPVIKNAVEVIQKAAANKDGLTGVPTGYHKLDDITSGWQPSDLVIIAGRPAMGKTSFALSMAKNIAADYKVPMAFFSLEMSNLQLVNRLISNACELPGEKIKSGDLTTSDWGQLAARLSRLQGLPLYVDDTSSLSIGEFSTKARRLVREHGIKLIIIDYLQLMTAGVKLGSREQEVSTISQTLKKMAKELDIPIIALSQLNRKLEDRGNKDKRPQLSDLRESGAIEQDADIVCFIHRPEYYQRSGVDAEGNDIRGLAEFIVAKHRNGRVDTVNMRFRKEYVRFENWDQNDFGSTGDFAYREASDNVDTAVPVSDPAKAAADAAAFGLNTSGAPQSDDFASADDSDQPF